MANKIWDYMHVHHRLEHADLILTLGNHDTGCARRTAEVFHEGYAPLLLFSGGTGRHTETFHKTEAEIFAEIAMEEGVPSEKILLETKATNTGENIICSKTLLADKGIKVQSIILVQKPYMERRTMATFEKQWLDMKFYVTSQQVTFDEYTAKIPAEHVINIMVGDLQRIIEYPAKGFQTYQNVPDDVLEAFNYLVAQRFDRDLLR